MINIYEAMLADPVYFKKLSIGKSILVGYHCPQKERWADLVTDLNHLIYTVSGERTVTRGERLVNLSSGSLLFLRKGAFKQGRFHEEDWNVIVFCIHDDHVRTIVRKLKGQFSKWRSGRLKTESMMQLDVNRTTHAFFSSIQPYFTQEPPPPENLLELKMEELMINLMLNPENSELSSFLEYIGDDSKYGFVEVMEANFMYNLSLSEFAKLNHVSLTVFKKKFNEIFSTTPGKWLLDKRLQLSFKMLLTSDTSVHDVAYDCGFESTTHFSRVFKEKYGVAPMQCRKENAN